MTSSKRPTRLAFGTFVAAILGVALAVLGMSAPASATPGTGTISGTVANSTHHGIANITVSLTLAPTSTTNDDVDTVVGDPFVTESDGEYSFSGLTTGQTYDVTYVDYNDVYLTDTVYGVTVTAGGTTIVNDTLHTGGVVEGKVVDDSGAGIDNIEVDGSDGSGETAITAGGGNFVLSGLPYGPQSIYVNGSEDGGPYDSDYTVAVVNVPTVTVDSGPTQVGDVTIDAPSHINGVVLGANNKPISNAYVEAYVATPNGEGRILTVDDDGDESVITGADGKFSLMGIPTGDVYLRFDPTFSPGAGSGLPIQFLGGSPDLASAIPVHVSTEGSTLYQAAELAANGAITGKVTSPKGTVLKNVPVSAQPLAAGSSTAVDQNAALLKGVGGYGVTNSKGVFTIPGLPAGSYQVSYNTRTSGQSLPANDTVNASVYLPATGKLTRNQAIGTRTKITGTVKAGTPSGPISSIEVQAFAYNTTTQTLGVSPTQYRADYTFTDNKGGYTLYLDPGTYVLRFTDTDNEYSTEFLGGTSEASDSHTTKLVVKSSAVSGENITLFEAPGSVTGTIIDSNGNAVTSSGDGGTVTLSRLDGPEGSFTSIYNEYNDVDAFPLTALPDGSYSLSLSATDGGENANLTSTPTVVDFTLANGALTEINGVTASGHDLGNIQLNPTTYTPNVQFTVNGAAPAINSTTDLHMSDTLSAIHGDWTPEPAHYYYQWYRDARPIAGATSVNYELGAADVGHALSVGIFFDDPNGPFSGLVPNFVTPQTDPVEADDLNGPVTAPSISGTGKVGSTLTALPGTWATSELSFSYQWISTVGGGTIVGHGATYKPTAADAEGDLLLEVTASRPGFNPLSAESSTVSVQLASAPKVTKGPKITTTTTGGVTTLSATSGTWSPSGATFTYLWLVHNPVSDSISLTQGGQTLTNVNPADRVELVITALKSGYANGTDTILAQSGQASITGTVSLDFAPQVSVPVGVKTSSLTVQPSDATLAYQWYRGTTKISGATKATYTPTSTDKGKLLSVAVTAVGTGYKTSTTNVASTGVIVAAANTLAVLTHPVINGTLDVGRTVTAAPAVVVPVPSKTTFQWYRIHSGGTPAKISGATKSTYTIATADLGDQLQVIATYSLSGWPTTPSTGVTDGTVSTLAIQNVDPPSTGAAALVGQTLKVTPGTWDVASTTYTYQWYEDDASIFGATSSSYVVPPAELGNSIYATVVAHRSGYADSAVANTEPVVVQAGAATVATGAPALTVGGSKISSLKLGQTITATPGTWPTTALAFGYQWQVNKGTGFANITHATTNSLTLDAATDPADFAAGYSYRVVVSATRIGYLDSAPVASAVLTIKPI